MRFHCRFSIFLKLKKDIKVSCCINYLRWYFNYHNAFSLSLFSFFFAFWKFIINWHLNRSKSKLSDLLKRVFKSFDGSFQHKYENVFYFLISCLEKQLQKVLNTPTMNVVNIPIGNWQTNQQQQQSTYTYIYTYFF